MAEAAIGRRILGEIEEASLEEILQSLRTSLNPPTAALSTATVPAGRTNADDDGLAVYAQAVPGAGQVKRFPIPALDALVARHFRASQSAPLAVSGRHLPLVYLLVATLVAAPHSKAVVVVDVDGRFDVTRVLESVPFEDEQGRRREHQESVAAQPSDSLAGAAGAQATSPTKDSDVLARGGEGVGADPATTTSASTSASTAAVRSHHDDRQQESEGVVAAAAATDGGHKLRVTLKDLQHIHVYRPARGSRYHIGEVIASAEQHMLYGRHGSGSREWWGTVVIGGGSTPSSSISTAAGTATADVKTGWRGWLRVDREEMRGFGAGMSVEEALADRERRQAAVDESGWVASCVWGGFAFSEAGSRRERR
ncbi:hypothetical protein NKR23_g1496 [Pleurostoma richardsiae]|uniref:Uncharacterized protein n=1 Tax=Pleurostoma richardsiae TaxID=41990 RepID=A0AA38VW58_9PEZI|nr:hypothetical protein NKR23_g1496 [Pleurostoma richardsiae]